MLFCNPVLSFFTSWISLVFSICISKIWVKRNTMNISGFLSLTFNFYFSYFFIYIYLCYLDRFSNLKNFSIHHHRVLYIYTKLAIMDQKIGFDNEWRARWKLKEKRKSGFNYYDQPINKPTNQLTTLKHFLYWTLFFPNEITLCCCFVE